MTHVQMIGHLHVICVQWFSTLRVENKLLGWAVFKENGKTSLKRRIETILKGLLQL